MNEKKERKKGKNEQVYEQEGGKTAYHGHTKYIFCIWLLKDSTISATVEAIRCDEEKPLCHGTFWIT